MDYGTGSRVPQAFRNFVKYITKAHDYENDKLYITRELKKLEGFLGHPNTTEANIKEALWIIAYCRILGYDTSFADIYAIKLCQSPTLSHKYLGYMASSILLDEKSEMSLLAINTLIKDVSSSHLACISMGLSLIPHIATQDVITTLLPSVLSALKHPSDTIRKKAVACLDKFFHLCPELLRGYSDNLRISLSDPDPGVMAMTLSIYLRLIKTEPQSYTHLFQGFLSTLKRIADGQIPQVYMYHNVPAPWTQVKLIHILTLLACQCSQMRSELTTTLLSMIEKTVSNESIAFALVCECISGLLQLSPSQEVLARVVQYTTRFLVSENYNLIYVGLEIAEKMVGMGFSLTPEQQGVIVECLQHNDSSICSKAHSFLGTLANQSNIVHIIDTLLPFITEKFTDPDVLTDKLNKLMVLATKYKTDDIWYMHTMLRLFEHLNLGNIDQQILNNFCCHFVNGKDTGKESVVNICIEMLSKKSLSPPTLYACTMIVGAHFIGQPGESNIMKLLVHHFVSCKCATLQCCIVNSLLKLNLRDVGNETDIRDAYLTLISNSQSPHVTQKIKELLSYVSNIDSFGSPRESLLEDESDLDLSLTFLDEYVCESLEAGEPAYKPKHLRHQKQNFNQEAGVPPKTSSMSFVPTPVAEDVAGLHKHPDSFSSSSPSGMTPQLNMENVERVWSKQGFKSNARLKEGVQAKDDQDKVNLKVALFGSPIT